MTSHYPVCGYLSQNLQSKAEHKAIMKPQKGKKKRKGIQSD